MSECTILSDLSYAAINRKAAAWRQVAQDADMSPRLNVIYIGIMSIVRRLLLANQLALAGLFISTIAMLTSVG